MDSYVIKKAKQCFEKAENISDQEQKLIKVKEGFQLLEDYVNDNPNLEDHEQEEVANLKRSYTRRFMEQFFKLRQVLPAVWGDFLDLLTSKLENEAVFAIQTEQHLKAFEGFIEIYKHELPPDVSNPPIELVEPPFDFAHVPIEDVVCVAPRLRPYTIVYFLKPALMTKTLPELLSPDGPDISKGMYVDSYPDLVSAQRRIPVYVATNPKIISARICHWRPKSLAETGLSAEGVPVLEQVVEDRPTFPWAVYEYEDSDTLTLFSLPVDEFENREQAVQRWKTEAETTLGDVIIVHRVFKE